MPVLIGCVGAGGTGKSRVVTEVIKNRKDVTMVPSIIRPSLIEMGYANEDAMRVCGPEKRLEIQSELLERYVHNLNRVIKEAKTRVLLFERTAIDHYGYILVHGGAALTVEHESRIDLLVGKALEKFSALVYFPYPTPFVDQANDGFRTTNGAIGQNFTLDHIYRAKMMTFKENGGYARQMISFDMDDRVKRLNEIIDLEIADHDNQIDAVG